MLNDGHPNNRPIQDFGYRNLEILNSDFCGKYYMDQHPNETDFRDMYEKRMMNMHP